ncbi:hypothetical protein JCM10450v2_003923 [Rhodotorula kratochvilovae]
MPAAKGDRRPNPAAPYEKRTTTRSSSRLASSRSAHSAAPTSSTSAGPCTTARTEFEALKANEKATNPAHKCDTRSSSNPPHIGGSSPKVTSTNTTEPSRDAFPALVDSAPKSPCEFSPDAPQTLCVRLPSSKDSDHHYEIDITVVLRRRDAPQFAGAADKLAENGEDANISSLSGCKQPSIVIVEVPLVLDAKTGRKGFGPLLDIPDAAMQGWTGSLAEELGKSIAETLKPAIEGKGKERACTPPPQRPAPAFHREAYRSESVACEADTSSPAASSSGVKLDVPSKKRPAEEDEDISTPAKKAKATTSSSEGNTAGSSPSSPPTSVQSSGGSTKINPLGGLAGFSTNPAIIPSVDRESAASAGASPVAEHPGGEYKTRSRRNADAADKACASQGDHIDLSLSSRAEDDNGRKNAPVPASPSPPSHSRKSAKGKRASASRRDVDAADDAEERPSRDLPAHPRSQSKMKARAEPASKEDADEPAPPAASQSQRSPSAASQQRPARRTTEPAPAPVRAQDRSQSRAVVPSTSRRAAAPAPAGRRAATPRSQTVFDSNGGFLSMRGGPLPPARNQGEQDLHDWWQEIATNCIEDFAAEAGPSWRLYHH